MSVVLDIVRSYVRPREVQARRMSGPPREDRALAILLGACGLIFVAQWPRMSREAFLDPSIPFDARMAGALFWWILMMPLVMYALSLLIHGVLRLLGIRVSGYRVRMALFWGLFASTPLWLLAGLMLGFEGPGPGANIFGSMAIGSFLVFTIIGLVAATRSGQETAV